MRDKLETAEWHSVSVVITFFEKLGVFLKNDTWIKNSLEAFLNMISIGGIAAT